MKKFTYILFFLFGMNSTVSAQEIYNNLKKGIQFIENENFSDAEATFKKIIEKNDTIKEAYFNLGNAVYGQKRYEEARENFNKALSYFDNKIDLSETHHNIGNTYMAEKKWEESIKSFKSALKNNPSDMDTKYNLAYALKMLEKQKQEEQKDKENKDDKKDENEEEKKEQDKDQENKDEEGDKEEEKKNEEKKEDQEEEKKDSDKGDEEKNEEPQDAKPEEMKLSKEEAERLLRAIEMQEQKLQDKKKQEDMTPIHINTDKDW